LQHRRGPQQWRLDHLAAGKKGAMSLLLDALNRASKDRAAADAAAPSPPTAGWPSIALQILPNPPPVEQAALPPEPPPEAASPKAARLLTLAATEPAGSGLRLEPMFMEPPAQAPVPADQPPSLNPAAPASPAATATAVSPAPAARPAEPLKVAQNMMRAKQGTLAVRPSRQRLLALGGVAGLLGLGGAVLWLGWLGPLALPGQPASQVPLASTPLVVNPAPTAVPANTVAPVVAPMLGSAEPPASAVAAASDPLAAMPAKAKKAARPAPAVAKAGRPAAVGLTSDTAPSTAAVAEVATPSTRPAARARAAASAAKPTELPNLLASTPSGARALELAYAALTQGRLADAEAGYKEVLKTSPEERDALLGLAYLAHQGGRGEGAKDFYQRVL
ncbi:MAG: tetratricopeptide repeat protein, partial [Betaproteobacteria bacterium]|nr:tetratricopeptide repeat protein [Betaproteobacteria bacterium]